MNFVMILAESESNPAGAAMAALIFLIFIVAFIVGNNSNPRNSASGRWGMKTGKFMSGDWGGEEWGEKKKKK